jgi:hypothetical protein
MADLNWIHYLALVLCEIGFIAMFCSVYKDICRMEIEEEGREADAKNHNGKIKR